MLHFFIALLILLNILIAHLKRQPSDWYGSGWQVSVIFYHWVVVAAAFLDIKRT